MLDKIRRRKRNSKKNRSSWARTSHLRNRPITGSQFADAQKGRFDWGGVKNSEQVK